MGFISGMVLFSDGKEAIVCERRGGVGYQIYCHYVLAEGSHCSLYLSQVVRETALDLYGFRSLRDKKMFEMLLQVKGVGPKSAYGLVTTLGADRIGGAIGEENKKLLASVRGVGSKAVSQIILDLTGKVHKIKMYSNVMGQNTRPDPSAGWGKDIILDQEDDDIPLASEYNNENQLLQEALLACKELGFKEDRIIGLAQRVLNDHEITRSEQLVHLVLKEI